MECRQYRDADYEAVCEFLTELNRKDRDHINWNWARFEWMIGHPEFDETAIGSIGLKLDEDTDLTEQDDECELGYWIGKPFWGRGLIPEAAGELLRHAFEDLGMAKVFCGYYDGNEKSKRVQEKIGMRYQWTAEEVDVPLMHETRKGHVNAITRQQWLGDRESGKSAGNPA